MCRQIQVIQSPDQHYQCRLNFPRTYEVTSCFVITLYTIVYDLSFNNIVVFKHTAVVQQQDFVELIDARAWRYCL